jgi:antitoxin FitA
MKSMIAHYTAMASITIRDLDDDVKARLRIRAAMRGHSMEEEARHILRASLAGDSGAPDERTDLGTAIHDRFSAIGGVELQLPRRSAIRRPPSLRK